VLDRDRGQVREPLDEALLAGTPPWRRPEQVEVRHIDLRPRARPVVGVGDGEPVGLELPRHDRPHPLVVVGDEDAGRPVVGRGAIVAPGQEERATSSRVERSLLIL
jgi:hypothetical protein